MTRDLAVVGVGNMGVSVLGAFLSRGRRCLAVDIDTQKVAELRRGKSLVPEHGADELFARAVRSGDLDASTDIRRVAEAACVFVGVQTPAHGDHCDYSSIQRVLSELAGCAPPGQPIVIGSTVFPGGIRRHLVPMLASRPDLALIYEPVFLRAGFGIDDYLRPGKFLFGLDDPRRVPERIRDLFESVVEAQPQYVSWEEAEWIKMVHNAWMGVKITFANEIDQLCRAYRADTRQVLRIAFMENERGRLMTLSHMMPGPPYSGPCLPKDAAVLGGIVTEHGPAWMQDSGVLRALRASNEHYLETLVDEWIDRGRAADRPLGIVGASFRPDFNEMRGSLALPFIRRARDAGLAVLAYDPLFEGIEWDDYRLACRGEKELEDLFDIVRHPLEAVWEHAGVLLVNRRLSDAEHRRVAGLARPVILDLYQNAI